MHPIETVSKPEAPVQNLPKPLHVLVLGGTGFIGRHAVAALQNAGVRVTVGSRQPDRHASRYPDVVFCCVRFEQLLAAQDWACLLATLSQSAKVDEVINCVGILRQRPGESYEDVHHHAPAALAQACAAAGIKLIHTSALALHAGAKSRFLSSKLRGEHAIAATSCDYAIVRPSLLDGEGGFGARWLRGLSRSPLQFIPRAARGGIAAMRCTDLGQALSVLASRPSLAAYREVELGGLHAYGYAEYLRALRTGYTTSQALQVPLPNWLARLSAHVCDVLHFSPFSNGHWILLQRHNLPQPNRLPELLGRAPLAIAPCSVPAHHKTLSNV